MPKTSRVKSVRVRGRRPTCLGCSLRGLRCNYGTLPGNCTECAQHKSLLALSDTYPRFSQVPSSFSELVQQAQATSPLQLYGRPNSMLRINAATVVDGLKCTHTLTVPGGSHDFQMQLRNKLDLLVRLLCFPNKHWTPALTELCQSAVDIRGYLALLLVLLSSHVNERRTTTRNGDDGDEVMYGSNLCLQLINVILPRLDELIGVVMDAFGKEQTSDDEDYWTDVTTAAAILYKGLHNVCSDLILGSTQPFCGGVELTGHLRVQVRSAVDNLMGSLLDRGLGCCSNLDTCINKTLDRLQFNILIENITLTQESHPVNSESTGYSPQGLSATAFSPYRSPGMEQVSPAGITNDRRSFVAFGGLDFHPVPSSALYSQPLPASCPAQLAMHYQVPESLTLTSASNQINHRAMAGHGHNFNDTNGFQLDPWMNPANQDSMQNTQHPPSNFQPTHHSYEPVWPMPRQSIVPTFGHIWPEETMISGLNSEPIAGYFGKDSFPQRNLQEAEYHSPLMPSYVSSTDMFNPPPETSIPMASPFLVPFWSENELRGVNPEP